VKKGVKDEEKKSLNESMENDEDEEDEGSKLESRPMSPS
jgi:hypothetical protein